MDEAAIVGINQLAHLIDALCTYIVATVDTTFHPTVFRPKSGT
jgi:hypothetical protein